MHKQQVLHVESAVAAVALHEVTLKELKAGVLSGYNLLAQRVSFGSCLVPLIPSIRHKDHGSAQFSSEIVEGVMFTFPKGAFLAFVVPFTPVKSAAIEGIPQCLDVFAHPEPPSAFFSSSSINCFSTSGGRFGRYFSASNRIACPSIPPISCLDVDNTFASSTYMII